MDVEGLNSISIDEEADRTRRSPFGWMAFAGAIGSLVTCYGSILAESVFDVESFGFNPHLQAVIMWSFGIVALYALWRDRQQHLRNLPLMMGGTGVAVLIFSLYVYYDMRFEILAYVFLLMGAMLNQNAMIGRLYQTVADQTKKIQQFNRNLQNEVHRQVAEIGRLNRLRSFLAPSVADMVIAENDDGMLDSHRRYVACLFCDIRNFTAATESLEPEETIALLRSYHDRIGQLVAERNGTIGYRAGDGIMVFFNDPIPCEEPVADAVRLALDIRESWPELRKRWKRLGHDIGVGIGISSGYATLGLIGEQGRADYTAIGSSVNLAGRLCEQARDGEILIDQRAYLDVEDKIETTGSEVRQIKGIAAPVETHSISRLVS